MIDGSYNIVDASQNTILHHFIFNRAATPPTRKEYTIVLDHQSSCFENACLMLLMSIVGIIVIILFVTHTFQP